MLDDDTQMLADKERRYGNTAVPIFLQAVHDDPKLLIEARVQITAAVDAICETIIRFDIPLGNVSYFTRRQRKRKTVTEGRYGRQIRKVAEESGYARSESLYVLPLSLWFSFGFNVFLWVYGLRL